MVSSRKRVARVATATVALILLLAIVTWRWATPAEPEYQGRTLSSWLRDMNISHRADGLVAQNKAEDAIQKMGPAALPYLFEMLTNRDSWAKAHFLTWYSNQHTFKFQVDSAWIIRDRAEYALNFLGTNTASFVPQLTQLLDNPEYAMDAACALQSGGPPALPAYNKALTNQNSRVQHFAIQGVRRTGGVAGSQACPALVSILDATNADVRVSAFETFGYVDISDAQIRELAPLIVKKAGDNLLGEGRLLVYVLARHGTNAQAITPVLLKALHDRSIPSDRLEIAVSTLQKVNPEAYRELMADRTEWPRIQAALNAALGGEK